MLWVPQKGIERVQHNLGAVGAALGTAVTTDTVSSATKGAVAELISAANNAFDTYWITIIASGYANAATTSQGCLDILVGGATDEVLIPNLLMGFCGSQPAIKRWDFPLYIPAGVRIAAQAAGDRLNTAVRVAVICFGGDGTPHHRVGRKVTTYGITTVPAGTDVAAGYSGAEGGWVEITSGTSEDHFAFLPSFHPTDGDTTLTPAKSVAIDIGVGAATEERLLGIDQSFTFAYNTGEECGGPYQGRPAFQDVPSGTRLTMRISMSGATDTGEPDGAIHAVS